MRELLLYYNFAGWGFHTKKHCSRLYSIEIKFYFLKQKIAFWATLAGLRGNVRTPSTARWKARGQLPIRHNWTYFTISYGWDVISENLSKLAFFEWGGSLWAQISDGTGRCQPTTVGVGKPKRVPFHAVSKYPQCMFNFVTKHASVRQTDRRTDWRTDRQNYDCQDRASIAASRGKSIVYAEKGN